MYDGSDVELRPGGGFDTEIRHYYSEYDCHYWVHAEHVLDCTGP